MEAINIRLLPKVGSKGIAIHVKHRAKSWEFSGWVARFMKIHQIDEAWFQGFDDNGWVWSHGIVQLQGKKAKITQIG